MSSPGAIPGDIPAPLAIEGAACRRAGGGLEARLLAGFVTPQPGGRLAELGTGCGWIALWIAQTHPDAHIDAIEIQPTLATLARANVRRCGLEERVVIWEGDLRTPPPAWRAGSYQQVIFNPPFHSARRGRLPPDPIRAAARFEIAGGLADFLTCARRLLAPEGRSFFVHRFERLAEIQAALTTAGLRAVRRIPIKTRPKAREAPKLALIEAIAGVGPAPPLEPSMGPDHPGSLPR